MRRGGVYVGIDGGQSGLRLGVAGSPVRAEAGGFTYDGGDPYACLVEAVRTAWAAADSTAPVLRAVLGLSGVPVAPDRRRALAEAVREALGAATVGVCSDVVTAHAGALPGADGVVLAAGTGVVALGVDPRTGRSRQVDGWGHLFGDDGSAFAVGRAGIAAALRAFDGRGEPTALVDAVADRFGPLPQVPERVYPSPTRVAEVAAFGPSVVAVAHAGDAVAAGIVAAAARALSETACAAGAVCTGPEVPIAVAGRWLTEPALRAAVQDQIRRRSGPIHRYLVAAAADGVTGACRLAESGAGPYGDRILWLSIRNPSC